MDYRALRAVIGGIAFLLVPVVYFGNWFIFTRHLGDCFWPNRRIPGSLSGFYYTHMRNLFVGAMCAMGVFFAAYRGYDRWDSRLTNVAGFAAICIALFPTMPPYYSQSPQGPNQFFTPSNLCGAATPITYHQSPHQWVFRDVHAASLVLLFVMVFLMVLVQFTKTKRPKGQQQPEDRRNPARRIRAWWNALFLVEQPKRRRNQVYVACAGGVAISGLLALVTALWPSAGKTAPWLLFSESGAFLFFGIAWYVKGAASAPRDHPQLLVRVLSRTIPLWLAGDPRDEPAGGSVPAAPGQP
jgi:hypothetical protein